MMDPVSIKRVALLHPKFRQQAIDFIDECESTFMRAFLVVQGMRTFEEQDAIYAQGRTTPGKVVTQAKGGQSYHNYGLAIDICPYKEGARVLDWNFKFKLLVPIAEKHLLQCGFKFPRPDADHFENKFGKNWRDLLALYKAGKFIPGTKFLKLD